MSDVSRFAGRSIGLAAALAVSFAGLAAAPAGATVDGDKVKINLAVISDFHGHLENAAVLSQKIKDMKAANPDTLFVANGDLVGGSAFVSAIQKDEPTLKILGDMGLDVSSIGNHEFDKGYSDLVNRIKDRASWPYLVSNIGTNDFPKHAILTTPSGVKIGFVGGVTDQLPTLVSSDGIAGLTITDPVAAVDKEAALLKDGDESNGEADIVVALIHETAGISKNVGPNVDAVVAGHTHHQVKETTASGALVVEPGEYGKAVGDIALTYNTATKKIESATSEIVDLVMKDSNGKLVPAFAEDPAIKAAYENVKVKSDELGAGTAGTIVGGADRATNNGTNLGANRGSEMTAGNMIAQAFYEYSKKMTKQADFAVMNPGGVRAEIDPDRDGVISFKESFSAQPFGNTYGTMDLTGKQVYTLFEQQWADKSTQISRPILQLGMSDSVYYTYNPDAPFGSHIKQVFVNGKLVARNDSQTYTVASNAFILGGSDGFNVFKKGTNFNDTGILDNEVFNEYLAANKDLVVPYDQRSVAITGEDTLKAGAKSTINLASLSMTYATKEQPLPTTAILKLDGKEIGSAAIDNTVTENLNETGKATVVVKIPSDVTAGEHTLTIVAGPTSLDIPVMVAAADTMVEPGQPMEPVPPVVDDSKMPRESLADSTQVSAEKKPMKVKKSGKKLAYTGSNALPAAGVGALVLLLGAAAVARTRREA